LQDEKGAGQAVLLHEVLPLVDLAEAKLVKQQLAYLLIFNEGRKSEMGFQALQDESLVVDGLPLGNL
jgi:hypothetical protein